MSAGSPLVCAACGSTHLRSSRPHGLREQLARTLGIRFHVCSDCGARGTHRGQHRTRRVKSTGPGRPLEPRDVKAIRARTLRRTAIVLGAIALGAWLGFYVWSCEAGSAGPRPPGAVGQ